MIIDFHTHCFARDKAPRVLAEFATKSRLYPTYDGTSDGLLKSMDFAGIDRAVHANTAYKPENTQNINKFALSIQSERIIPFGTIHAENANYKEIINDLKAEGIKGIKLHPDYQGYYINDKSAMAMYEHILSQNLIILMHVGVYDEYENVEYTEISRIKDVINRFPTKKLVLSHVGGLDKFKTWEEHLLGKDFSLGTSFGVTNIDYGRFKDIVKSHGEDKLLFATGAPWKDQNDELTQYYSFELKTKTLRNILGLNAANLLDINE